jgi:Ca-activated chloride channel homolog
MQRLFSGLVAVLVALAAVSSAGADRGAAGANGGTARVSQVDATAFPTVDVYVSVLDRNQHPIAGLHQQDFRVFENGQKVPFALASSGFDVSVVLVIDQSGSMAYAGKMEAAQQAALTFLDKMRSHDRVALIAFSDAVTVAQPLSTNKVATAAQVQRLAPLRGTALFDATMHALDMLRPVRGRKAAIVLTDGMDNQSRARIDDVVKRARQDTASIYTIGLGTRSSTSSTSSDAGIDEEVLKRLADATTGQYYYAPDPSTLSRLYQHLAEQLGSEYRLRYHTPRNVHDGTRRSVDVRVRVAGTGEVTASGSYLVGGVLGAGGINWLVFAALFAVLAALLYPGGVPALVDARSARVRAGGAAASRVVPPPSFGDVVRGRQVPDGASPWRISSSPPTAGTVGTNAATHRPTGVATQTSAFHLVELTPGGRLYRLRSGSRVRIGRAPDNDIVIDDPTVSGTHAELRDEAGHWVVTDLGSTNGTYVSYSGAGAERRVAVNALRDGSTVRFGEVRLRLERQARNAPLVSGKA